VLLCVHGFPECWSSWRHWLRALAGEGRFRVVAVDLRGFGGSPLAAPPSWWRSRECAGREVVADLVALVDELLRERAEALAAGAGAGLPRADAAPHRVR
jgi:pimeloyl-ACP methyl ester carboxylesterase